ncbi:T9SS type A sorting domain-containing protein [Hymenobacter daecheongensis]|nr:T9SS type A sorting domain-containing protein [Hymenobacter daecheongensis]
MLIAAVAAPLVPLYAQVPPNFDRVEYFFDADPGYGQGTALTLSATPGTTLSSLAFTASLDPLTPGFHTISIRSRAGANNWSHTYRQILYKEPAATTTGPVPALAGAEYFIDGDPGYGGGTAVAITGGSTNAAGVAFTANLGSVPAGFHTLSVRSRDVNGRWSHTYRQIFYVEPAATTITPPANLAAVEYFVDTDPGYGNGTSVAIGGSVTNATGVTFAVGLGSLPVGFHTLFYRSRDVNGRWSHTQSRIFYVDDPTVATIPNLNKAEYYVDTDPGYGSATDIPIATPATSLPSLNMLADLSGLTDGPHRLFVRVRSATGGWSQVLNRSFTKSGCASATNMAAGLPATRYTGSGLGGGVSEAIFNGGVVGTSGSSTFLDNYYAQADLGSALLPISEVQLNLRNVNGTAVNYTLEIETSGNLTTWTRIDNFQATLAANQTAPVLVTRTLATVQNNVRGIRLRLRLPTISQGIQMTNAGVFYFNCMGPTITSFTPAGGPAGTAVTITGTDLNGATLVRFNGVAAGAITNNTPTSLTVAAPAGGSSGQICVTTPGGTACSAQSYNYPSAIATGTVAQSTICAGQTMTVPFSTRVADFGTGNVFNFQLSDASGVFAANAPLLGTLSGSTANGGTLSGTIPLNTPAGTGYRVRVVASNPAVTGADNGVNLTINTTPVSQATGPATVANGSPINLTVAPIYARATYSWSGPLGFSSTQQSPTLASATNPGVNRFNVTVTLGSCSYSSFVDVTVQPSTDPLLTLQPLTGPLCPATPRSLSFSVSGNAFPAGNVISAQLSDASGSFASPELLGTASFSGLGSGAVTATLPRTTAVGAGYRIRLVGSNPATIVSNDNGSDLTVNALPTVTVGSNSPVTAGSTIQLQGGPAVAGNSYAWTFTPPGGFTGTISTQQNPQLTNAQTTQSGRYRLFITNAAGCTDSASVRVLVTPVAPVTTLNLSPVSGPLCAGTSYQLSYTAAGPAFNAGNTISAVLSDANGAFSAGSPVIGSVSVTAAVAGTLSATIPATTPAGSGYRIQLVSSNPVLVSNSSGALVVTNLTTASAGSNSPVATGSSISLTATGISGATYAWTGPNNYSATGPNQTISGATAANAGDYQVTITLNGCTTTVITTVVVNPPVTVASIQTGSLAGSYCAGTALSVPFTATGFTAGNVFTAQLSSATGVFSGSPVSIGTLTGTTTGTIAALIPAGTAAGTGYRIRVVGSGPATIGTDNGTDLVLTAAGTFTWSGAVNNSWFDPANWSCGTVPTSASSILIPAGMTTYPVLGVGGPVPTALHLTIANGATCTLNGSLTLLGNLVNNGTLNANNGTLLCSGSTAQTVSGSSFRLFDLTVSNPAGVTLQTPLRLRHLLTLTSGNLASNGNLTLLSDATGTAMVVNPIGGGTVTGRSTMERFITGAGTQGYRHYSSPMQLGTATVQEFADDVSGFNLNPDYNTQGNTVTPFPTFFKYDESRLNSTATNLFSQGWMVPLATDNLVPGQGYTVQTEPTTTVDVSGTLGNGAVSFAMTRGGQTGSGWNLAGNPYPAPIDWDKVPAAAGVDKALYVFVPSGKYTGTYSSYIDGIGQNGGTKDLAPMQGFFLRATAPTATLSMTNDVRHTTYISPVFNRGSNGRATAAVRPIVRLHVRNDLGQGDETVLYFDPNAGLDFRPNHDAYKVQLNGSGIPSLWSIADADGLSINGLPSLAAAASIPLGVRVSKAGQHTLNAGQMLNLPAGTEVFLEDRVLRQQQNLLVDSVYAFQMVPSYTGQRFYLRIVSRPTATAGSALDAAAKLYPNPTTHTATLELTGLREQEAVQITVHNTLGQAVQELSGRPRRGVLRQQLDMSKLPVGVYSMRVRAAEGTVVKRLVRE